MGKKKDNTMAELESEQKRAEQEASALRAERERESDALKRRKLGRASLVKTSELGVTDELG